ncbi:hypothetical protein SAMN05444274_11156 [Mariniphaga anaerophila]|uniref:Uncharacterized protein n=1 Tax=Mariniphaga anaerophila TaxID=1484053 RepID=A0A1M5F7Z7_9BACT|nr:hypothetical protein [Mariniphaga anaerophila]SHF87627.1 hypothetical protein SAMN05444274_11156 [Mariniphaga anaerophila]
MYKFRILILLIGIALISTSSKKAHTNEMSGDECDVVNFYEAIEPETGMKVLTSGGDLEEPELLLLPTEFEEGVYEIEITREESNLYEIEGTAYYIETKFCYDFASRDEAILKVKSNISFQKGTLFFE